MTEKTQNQSKRKRIYTRFWYQAILTALFVLIGYCVWYFALGKSIEENYTLRTSFVFYCIDGYMDDAEPFGGCSAIADQLEEYGINQIKEVCLRPGEDFVYEATVYDASLYRCLRDEGVIPF